MTVNPPKAASDEARSRTYRLFARYVAFAERHTLPLLCALAALALGAALLASRLQLHTEMSELLPDEHPAVQAYRRISGRQKSGSNLVMLIHSPSVEANHRFAEALRPALSKMVPKTFSEVVWKPDTEVPDYAAKWKWLYADRADLENAESLLDRIIAQRGNPLSVDLEGDPDDELKELRDRLNKKLPQRKDADYFEAEADGQHWLGIMMWRRLGGLATQEDRTTFETVKSLVEKVDPTKFDPHMGVAFTGGIAQAIDEQNGIKEDLTIATVVCGTLVLCAIFLYFRRFALLLVIGAPAVMGLFLALALASVTIRYLNINTAFLISIILGNGINAPIVLLARYGEERQRGVPVGPALSTAMSETFIGTLTAMGAASVAYGCLLLTSFRGFNQFGLLGGAGMLLVWLTSFVLVPPMVLLGERWKPGSLTPRANLWRVPFGALGRLAERRPLALGALSLLLLGLAVTPLVRYVRDPLEWDFNNLRTDETPSGRLWGRMEKLGMGNMGAGYIGNNGVLLVDSPEQADPVARAMKAQDEAKGPKGHVLKEVRTLSSMLPKEQPEKLEILARIRSKIDRHLGSMSADERAEATAWRPPDTLRPVGVDDLPRQVREAFTETDGQRGRLVGIDADHKTYYDWNGHDLLRMSKALTVDALGKRWVAASAATVFAGMLETIISDGPRVTFWALVGVTLLVLFGFGLRGGVPVLASLALGIAWLGGCLGLFKIKINFMNFVALPITLGIGAEYAANIWARLRVQLRETGLGELSAGRHERISDVIADTGSAVALCSLTTIIGYSSLLMSHNNALRSFGRLADLGEITCLVAALVALPVGARLVEKARLARQR